MLQFQSNAFNGLEIQSNRLPSDITKFEAELDALILFAKEQKKLLLWIELERIQSVYIPLLVERDFVFHNCSEETVVMIRRIQKAAYAPFIPTHTIGTGAVVTNSRGELLVVRERHARTDAYKLPGGMVELGERVECAVVREVKEECGIDAEFEGVVALMDKHPFRFGKSNLYVVCKLKALSETITIYDTDEILEARWLEVSQFYNDTKVHDVNKKFVKSALRNTPLGFQPLQASGDYAVLYH